MSSPLIVLIFIILFFFASELSADTQFTITNSCPFTVWVGIQSNEGSQTEPDYKLPYNGGWELNSGDFSNIFLPSDIKGARIWGRTGCSSSGTNCATGDCGALECAGRQGQKPATLAEFGLCAWECLDFYDISLVDGFNLPMVFKPKNPFPGVECPELSCTSNVNAVCPEDLKVWVDEQVVACDSSCVKYQRDQDCCVNEYNNPDCPKSASAYVFKSACPDAYSYAKDDTSSKACKQTGYDVVFCGKSSSS